MSSSESPRAPGAALSQRRKVWSWAVGSTRGSADAADCKGWAACCGFDHAGDARSDASNGATKSGRNEGAIFTARLLLRRNCWYRRLRDAGRSVAPTKIRQNSVRGLFFRFRREFLEHLVQRLVEVFLV